jgi:hypothetical protein
LVFVVKTPWKGQTNIHTNRQSTNLKDFYFILY